MILRHLSYKQITKIPSKSYKKLCFKINANKHRKISEFWSKIRSKIEPKIYVKFNTKIERHKKLGYQEPTLAQSAERGKEFLPETPGSRFAIGKSSSNKQPSSK